MGPFTSAQAQALDRALKAYGGAAWQRAAAQDAIDTIRRSLLPTEEKAELQRTLESLTGFLRGLEEAVEPS